MNTIRTIYGLLKLVASLSVGIVLAIKYAVKGAFEDE